jgi:hypothetical protein
LGAKIRIKQYSCKKYTLLKHSCILTSSLTHAIIKHHAFKLTTTITTTTTPTIPTTCPTITTPKQQ